MSRNKSYPYYTLFMLVIIFFISDFSGYNLKFLWPNHGLLAEKGIAIFMSLVPMLHLLFIRKFLRLKQQHSRLNHIFSVYIFAHICSLISVMFTSSYGYMLMLGALGLPLLMYTAYWSYRQPISAGKTFAVSLLSHIVFINLLSIIGAMGNNLFPFINLQDYLKIGYLFESIFFSLAMAIQNKDIQKSFVNSLYDRVKEAEQFSQIEQQKNLLLKDTETKILQFASATHDIAQPLSSIRMALGALPKEKSTEIIAHIDKTVDYAEQLVRSLNQNSQTDFNKLSQTIYLQDFFAQLQQTFQTSAEQKGLQLKYFSSQKSIITSEHSLTRIMDNLLSNAIRYTHKGKILIGVRQRSNHIRIEVWDTGIGISKDKIQQLTQAFAQINDGDNNKLGYGLGLHIVKLMCEQAGYRLTINSELGKGSCFAVELPLDAD